VIINSFCLKFVRLKSSPQKTCLSDVDGANSIRDYFFCQQLISRNRFSGSYLGKKLAVLSRRIFVTIFIRTRLIFIDGF